MVLRWLTDFLTAPRRLRTALDDKWHLHETISTLSQRVKELHQGNYQQFLQIQRLSTQDGLHDLLCEMTELRERLAFWEQHGTIPLQRCKTGGKPGFRWGEQGHCFTYTPGDQESRDEARKSAVLHAGRQRSL